MMTPAAAMMASLILRSKVGGGRRRYDLAGVRAPGWGRRWRRGEYSWLRLDAEAGGLSGGSVGRGRLEASAHALGAAESARVAVVFWGRVPALAVES